MSQNKTVIKGLEPADAPNGASSNPYTRVVRPGAKGTVVPGMEGAITNAAGIPVFGSEVEQVKVGCAASASIDYLEVGRLAGVAAAEILGGKAAKDIPVKIISDPTNYYNSEVCTRLGLTVPTTIQVTDVKAQ